jgi:hypothetical protein
MNIFEEEVIDLFSLLHKKSVKFILVGGLAVNYYGYSRATGDIDLWIYDETENRKKLIEVFKTIGVEGAEALENMPLIAGFSEILLNNGIYIDLMSELQFFRKDNFNECYDISETLMLEEDCPVKVLHINKLIEEKEKSKRGKDNEDAVQLKKIRDLRKKA